MILTSAQLHILQHSLGVDQYGQGDQYRNRFVTDSKTVDWPVCNELVAAGFMAAKRNIAAFGGSDFFWVTEAGKQAMADNSPAPPKPTKQSRSKQRYKRYLEYRDSFDSFIEFCRWDAQKERSWNGGTQ